MNSKSLKIAALCLMSAAILSSTSCSSKGPPTHGQGASMVAVQKGVPGGTFVDTYKVTATVTSVDPVSRKLTLVAPDGTSTTFTAGPAVVNFNQIRLGDQVKATTLEQLVVFVRKSDEPSSDGAASVVALAPVGAKPGVVMANTVEVTAKVEKIDLGSRKATLKFPDGKSKTFKVRQDVDLTKAKIGDEVVFRTTEAVAILVEKP